MKHAIILSGFVVLGAFHVSAQEERRQAAITGRGGSPKCTIEVEVDEVADVEIHGTTARLHTLRGGPATWRRFECNEPMPANPANFRFRGIDGRGRQTLIGDPSRGGAAVVRIEDSKSGREGYTFDLEWQGSAGPNNGGPGNGPGYPQQIPPQIPPQAPTQGDNRDRGHDPDRDRGGLRDDRDGHFTSSDAIHQCGEAAQAQLRRNGYSDTQVTNTSIDDQPGHNDWISGTLTGRRGPYAENFSFACPVDLEARRVGDVNVRPANDGYYGRDGFRNKFSREQALSACTAAVQERLRRADYRGFQVTQIDLDDRPGDNDWVVGGLTARRGGFTDNFAFSCSIDFDEGRVRSINVERR